MRRIVSSILLAVWGFAGFALPPVFGQQPRAVGDGLEAPSPVVRALYVTSATAHNRERIENLRRLIRETRLSAIVINVKEDGAIFSDALRALVAELNAENIFPIARIVVFKDVSIVRQDPQFALRHAAGGLWRDSKGSTWLDPAARGAWAQFVHMARVAADMGFREINLDYVRFPTEGGIANIRYTAWDGKTPRTEVIAAFFEYFNTELKKTHPHIQTSLDIFGYTFLTSSGLNIGQRVEDAAKYFDIIAPMVYPSHYSTGNFGFENPAAHPYDVIRRTLESGFKKLPPDFPRTKVRPWLQAFDMGASYDAGMLAEEIRALKDTGIDEYYLWNPRNVYDRYRGALQKATE